ncbi:MAG: hypothetical protein HY534_02510 [Chloroflexi bacterium]|nr:hypothetical protein [Chloroflexota bacterium]
MPDIDPSGNAGFLIAAVTITLTALIGYALALRQRITRSLERNKRLRGTRGDSP